MTIVLLSGDLMGASRVEGAVRQAGADFRLVPTIDAAAAICGQQPVAAVMVDLATPGLDPAELVQRIHSGADQPPAIIAFGPHVLDERLAAAEQAGCDQVLSRGQFMAQIQEVLARYVATKPV